jgi:two-component system nitrogen regulation response regulator NtrX
MINNNVLIVDDEKDIQELIADIVEDAGYKPLRASNSQKAFELLAETTPAAVILDIWLKESELDGLGILEFIKLKYADIPVIMISGHGNIETALRSLKIGAYDFVEKPFKQDKLLNVLENGIENYRLKTENAELRKHSQKIDFLAGDSATIKTLKAEIDRLAKTESRVFIKGEIGVGKEIIAEQIHANSKRANNPFIQLNLYQHNPETLEETLFGTEDKGDLNSPARKVGLLEIARGGTLFINEVSDLPKKVQDKFVKFLTDGKFTRVGGTKTIESNVRVIAATNKDINKKIENGDFRGDLYHRLNVVELRIPSLRERREDIPQIAEYFSDFFSKKYNFPNRGFSQESVVALQSYNWPGNVRQLQNVVEWLLIMYPTENVSDKIKPSALPKEIVSEGNVVNLVSSSNGTDDQDKELMSLKLRDARQVFEKQYLLAQINRFGGNISRTASFIGMERSALHRKLKSLEVAQAAGEEILGDDYDDEDDKQIA